jgi:FHA domain
MTEEKTAPGKKSISADWLVRGVLTKIGDTLDRFTGRRKKPVSSLATTELIDRVRKLLDAKVRDLGPKGRFVPHVIRLKMEWNKVSEDVSDALKTIEYTLHAAAIDHINDNLYHTYAPLRVEVKPDYFTEGVQLQASFDDLADEEQSDVKLNLTVPVVNVRELVPSVEPAEAGETVTAEFTLNGKTKLLEIPAAPGKRISVGRLKESTLWIDDASVSKIHAALSLNSGNKLIVADTGSTNGTFLNGERIAYGKALEVSDGDTVKFGNVEVVLKMAPRPAGFATRDAYTLPSGVMTQPTVTPEEINSASPTPDDETASVAGPAAGDDSAA